MTRPSCRIVTSPNSLSLPLNFFICGTTSFAASLPVVAPSKLPFRQAQDETIKLLSDFDLAGQTTARQPLGGHAIQQRVFFLTHGGEAADPVVVDIHMAGGAHGISAALRHDLVNAMPRRGQHGALADACFDALGPVVGADESDDRHGIQTGLRVMGRLSKPRSVLL